MKHTTILDDLEVNLHTGQTTISQSKHCGIMFLTTLAPTTQVQPYSAVYAKDMGLVSVGDYITYWKHGKVNFEYFLNQFYANNTFTFTDTVWKNDSLFHPYWRSPGSHSYPRVREGTLTDE